VDVAGGGPLGRRALFGLGENDEGGRAPPQAGWRLDKVVLTLVGEVKRVRGANRAEEGLSPGKPFLVGFGCRTVAAMDRRVYKKR
jgi:hypothetical protein